MILLRSIRLIFILLGVSCMNSEFSDPEKVINGYIIALIESDFNKMRYYSTGEEVGVFKDDWMLKVMSNLKKTSRKKEDYSWTFKNIQANGIFFTATITLFAPDVNSIAKKMAEVLGYDDPKQKIAKTDEEAEAIAMKDPNIKPLKYEVKVRLQRIATGWVAGTNNVELIQIFFPNYKP